MPRPSYLPEHYRIEVVGFAESKDTLDALYAEGWTVIKMAAHPDGTSAICLLEKSS